MSWLVRRAPSADDEVLATAEVAATRAARRRGLLGRDEIDGVLVLRPCRQVHTFRMRVPIDVVWCAGDGRVLRITTLVPGRVSRPVLRSRFVIEAAAGATDRWLLQVGDTVEITDGRAGSGV
jgi:uncharacterized membrane protein (UPF0127 family)